jgi:large-conductance mechanosensitive channel
MSMLKEFKEFAVKGNVVDMAVGPSGPSCRAW